MNIISLVVIYLFISIIGVVIAGYIIYTIHNKNLVEIKKISYVPINISKHQKSTNENSETHENIFEKKTEESINPKPPSKEQITSIQKPSSTHNISNDDTEINNPYYGMKAKNSTHQKYLDYPKLSKRRIKFLSTLHHQFPFSPKNFKPK